METLDNNICTRLGDLIKTSLAPLITSDYLYIDLPYHSNIGDILIWKGTEEFLRQLPGKCLGRHSKDTFFLRPLPQDVVILMHGGGNFGDIWREHQEFRLEIISRYPDNPIIVLPQTIHYDSEEVFAEDVRKMNLHSRLTVCARDSHSAELLKEKGFTGHLLTLPDMAFCINQNELQAEMAEASQESLILFREDKELKEPKLRGKYMNAALSDWPEMQESGARVWKFLMTHEGKESDAFFIDTFFPQKIKDGVRFVSAYKDVCSTRLHVAILRLLLGLPVKMIDNSYGKNLNFYYSWLKDSPLVSMPNEEEQEAIDLAILIRKRELDQKTRCEKQLDEMRQEMKLRIREQEENIRRLQQEADTEARKHRKYKKLFFLSMIALAVLIILFVIKN